MYIDIGKIKREVTMVMLLQYYGINLREAGKNSLVGTCPIHHGDNPNAFRVDTERNLFNCFTHCGGGSIIDFVMKKEKLSCYHAALRIHKTFHSLETNPKAQKSQTPKNLKLKLRFDHPYLEKRNVTAHIARFFQLGFCSSGLMKDRIAIPITDTDKNILAYCGRTIHPNVSPRYLFPKGFRKSEYLFNIQNIIYGSPNPVFIVEGFFDCIHVHSLGFDSVALMGTTISKQQIDLLKHTGRRYILMLDGDRTGKQAMARIGSILKRENISFKSVYLCHKKEPEMLSKDDLEGIAGPHF
jgi:DNA primase